jgi:hypothetical protein
MAGLVLPGLAPKLHLPAYRLIVPVSSVSFSSDADDDKNSYVGLRINADASIDRIQTDTATDTAEYIAWGSLLTRPLITGRLPGDLQVKATDMEASISDTGTTSPFYAAGYNTATGYHRDIDGGDTLGAWHNVSSAPEWWCHIKESGATMIARRSRIKLEVQSTTLGWSAIWDFKLSQNVEGTGTGGGSPDVIDLPR